MKKFLLSFLLIVVILSTMCVFATEVSGDGNQVIEIENYEQYENLFSTEQSLTDEEYEELYAAQMKELAKYYEDYKAEELTKAKVIEAGEPEYIYEAYTGEYIFKFKKQEIKVEIMEGEYKGKELTLEYPLTADMFLNLDVAELHKGDVIYVYPYADGENVEAEIGTTGNNVERKVGVIVLMVVTVLLMITFGREKGLISTLIVALIAVLVLIIGAEQIYAGTPIIALTLIFALVISAMMAISKFRLSKDAVAVTAVSMIVILFVTLLTYGVDALLKNTGGTFETTFLIETIVTGNIDFHALFVGGIVLILSVAVPNVVSKVWCKCKKANTDNVTELLKVSKSAISGTSEMVTAILTTLFIPKLLYLYSPRLMSTYAYKYTANEILNSDVLITEIIRWCMVLIGMAIAVPVATYTFKILYKNVEEKKVNE